MKSRRACCRCGGRASMSTAAGTRTGGVLGSTGRAPSMSRRTASSSALMAWARLGGIGSPGCQPSLASFWTSSLVRKTLPAWKGRVPTPGMVVGRGDSSPGGRGCDRAGGVFAAVTRIPVLAGSVMSGPSDDQVVVLESVANEAGVGRLLVEGAAVLAVGFFGVVEVEVFRAEVAALLPLLVARERLQRRAV